MHATRCACAGRPHARWYAPRGWTPRPGGRARVFAIGHFQFAFRQPLHPRRRPRISKDQSGPTGLDALSGRRRVRKSANTTYPNAANEAVPSTCPTDMATITGHTVGSKICQVISASAARAQTHESVSNRRVRCTVMDGPPRQERERRGGRGRGNRRSRSSNARCACRPPTLDGPAP